jgi:hypothetical protein
MWFYSLVRSMSMVSWNFPKESYCGEVRFHSGVKVFELVSSAIQR